MSLETGLKSDRREANAFDVASIRADFPILSRKVHGKQLVYLDSAASAQKPQQVIDTVRHYYESTYANVHRGAYFLSETVTSDYESARLKVCDFLNARVAAEIVFTKGATEAINLVAQCYGRTFLEEGDQVLLTDLEHHSNIVPWQLLRDAIGVELVVVPVRSDGDVLLEDFEKAINTRTKIVAVTHVSNVLGTVLPIRGITDLAHSVGARVLVDGCQGIVHGPVDVRDLEVDFYVFSGHKLYAPNGIGILYAKGDLLSLMPPYQGGGDMIKSVTFERSEWAEPPAKFEAGTPPIVPAIGLGSAIDYVSTIGMESISSHENAVLTYAMEMLATIDSLRLVGRPLRKAPVISFVIDGIHPHDIATILDRTGVCIRAGHHCAQPLMDRLELAATARASFAMYNTLEDVDKLVAAVRLAKEMFG